MLEIAGTAALVCVVIDAVLLLGMIYAFARWMRKNAD